MASIVTGAAATPAEWLPLRASVDAGAAIVYDSRTLHRGRANLAAQRRPALVLRYDRLGTPPPGVGIGSTALLRIGGLAAERLSTSMAGEGATEGSGA